MYSEMYGQIINIIDAAMSMATKETRDDLSRNPTDRVRVFEDSSVYIQVRDRPNLFELTISPKTANGGYDIANPIFAIRLQPHAWLVEKMDGLHKSSAEEAFCMSPPAWLPDWAQEMWKK
jgi:hypothetical protein